MKEIDEQGRTEQAGRASRGRRLDGTGATGRAGGTAGQDTAGRGSGKIIDRELLGMAH